MVLHVLLVDDEPLIVRSIEHSIEWTDIDCKVTAVAYNGHQAMDILKKQDIDILVTDISMPQATGLDLMRTMQSLPKQPLMIIVSGYDDFEYAREGLKYNAFDYILKPIDYEELQQCLHKAVQYLQKQRLEFYNQRKHIIYEAIHDKTIASRHPEVSNDYLPFLLEKNTEADMKVFFKQLETSFDPFQVNVYQYGRTDQRYLLTIECTKEKIELETVLTILKNKDNFYQVLTISEVFVKLEELQAVVQQLESLMDMKKFAESKIITQSYMQDFYQNKQSLQHVIDNALLFIEQNFDQDIGNEEVAREVDLSVSYFSNIFKKTIGMTFLEYLTDLRMKYACQFLIESDWKTYEIAQKVGYMDQRYFSQVFKRKKGMTPSEYRKNYQK